LRYKNATSSPLEIEHLVWRKRACESFWSALRISADSRIAGVGAVPLQEPSRDCACICTRGNFFVTEFSWLSSYRDFGILPESHQSRRGTLRPDAALNPIAPPATLPRSGRFLCQLAKIIPVSTDKTNTRNPYDPYNQGSCCDRNRGLLGPRTTCEP
jgi:hypothetical protein